MSFGFLTCQTRNLHEMMKIHQNSDGRQSSTDEFPAEILFPALPNWLKSMSFEQIFHITPRLLGSFADARYIFFAQIDLLSELDCLKKVQKWIVGQNIVSTLPKLVEVHPNRRKIFGDL